MTSTLTPDICVIGAGSGGLSVAAAAASFGVSVVLVEKARMGGDCLNYGCVPSKALIAAARRAEAMRSAGPFGIAGVEPEIDFAKVNRHVHGVIAAIAPNDSVERFTALGVRVIETEARFRDARTLIAGDHEICARRFVIATGSSPAIPPIPGLDKVEFLTNETIFDLADRPERLLVIGGGAIGTELAQAFRRLGSEVTLVEAAAVLGREDPELAAHVVDQLRAEGVKIFEHAKISSVERRDEAGIRVRISGKDGEHLLEGTHLLVAIGRKPVTASLGLDAAGIEHSPRGITVDAGLRTTNRRIYAIGDVAGGPQFTHAANYHAGLVLRSILFRMPVRENHVAIPRVTFTDPELAHVGLSEADARQAGKRISVLRWPYSENDRAQTERKTEGLIKLIVGRRGRILGASIVGADAGEMINMWALAISRRMKVGALAGYVAPYPTMSEIGKRAAITYFINATRKPIVRRLVRCLRIFG
ncbi:FAD-dependent oxidoreductase [Aquamicrobium sp. LC103]|uniref:dihydrolipoyl dehydrogenase family protein n=1 Tax=Aquamicrobium sp. LC103 TaxID=1120658 RepID=UPI00063E7D42|nr:FAD-dependent oxidoreductase [Aquamicrobium sp. LC103]TKT75094.1 dihydrolipoamide dehydrogenase [Aquamicrobium sp. LC103]